MKKLNTEEEKTFLEKFHMSVGGWGQIIPVQPDADLACSECYQAPQSAKALFCFSQYVASWVIGGDWKLLKTDFSNSFSADEEVVLRHLILGSEEGALDWRESYISHMSSHDEARYENGLRWASLIFHFLLFEGHGYILSFHKGKIKMLGLQDGFVYFYSPSSDIGSSELIMRECFGSPEVSPSWVVECFI